MTLPAADLSCFVLIDAARRLSEPGVSWMPPYDRATKIDPLLERPVRSLLAGSLGVQGRLRRNGRRANGRVEMSKADGCDFGPTANCNRGRNSNTDVDQKALSLGLCYHFTLVTCITC